MYFPLLFLWLITDIVNFEINYYKIKDELDQCAGLEPSDYILHRILRINNTNISSCFPSSLALYGAKSIFFYFLFEIA